MRLTGAMVPALSDNTVVFGDYAAHARIRIGGVQAALSQLQCMGHMLFVLTHADILLC